MTCSCNIISEYLLCFVLADKEPEFDWGKYLLEDLDPLKNFDEPSSDVSWDLIQSLS